MKAVLVSILFASQAHAWALVANNKVAGTTISFNTTGANLLIAAIAWNAGSDSGVSDLVGGNSNSWTLAKTGVTVRLYYSIPTYTGANHVFTITNMSGGTNFAISVAAFSGARATGTLDSQTSSNFSNPATTISPGSITPGNTDVLVVSAVDFNNSTSSPPAVDGSMTFLNGTQSGASEGLSMAYNVQATPAAINPTWSQNGGSTSWAGAVIVSFLAADSAPPAPPGGGAIRHRIIGDE